MMKRFADILFLPVLAFASLIMLLHEFRPTLWRNCVRPAVCRMRDTVRHSYVSKARCVSKTENSANTLIRSFDKEIKTIIRLIRLESEEIASGFSGFFNNRIKNRKESTLGMAYSLFV